MAAANTAPNTASDFWKLLVQSRLHAPARVADLRSAFEAGRAMESPQPAAVAEWLVAQRHLTRWQARRLLRGEPGSFFIGDYRLLERTESVGGASLLRAIHTPSARRVMLTLLDRTRCRNVETWTSIVRRTGLAHQMSDPMFSKTWALEQVDGNRIIVCEDVPGGSLSQELATRGGLPLQEAGWIGYLLARALAEHHRLAGVHGAISLDSLRREPARADAASGSVGGTIDAGRVRLLQYPLVGDPHATPPRMPLEDSTAVGRLGTRAAFIAPECILGGGACTESSDIYSVGCVLAALLDGTPPGWEGDPSATLARTARTGFQPPGPPAVPLEVGTLVSYLTARDPAGRYPTAEDAASAIAACFGFPDVPLARSSEPSAGGTAAPASRPSQTFVDVGPTAATPATPRPSPAACGLNDATRRARRRAAIFRAGFVAVTAAVLVAAVGGLVISQSRSRSGRGDNREDRGVAQTEPIVSADSDDHPMETEVAAKTPPAAPTPSLSDEGSETAAPPTKPSAPPSAADTIALVDDPGALWDAPTHGGPPSLEYLPPGSQAIFVVRLADALATDEGRLLLKATGPAVEAAIAEAGRLCGCQPENIERLLAGWQTNSAGKPVAAFTFELTEPIDAEKPPKAWGPTTPEASKKSEETVYRGQGLSFAVPKARGGRLLVAAPHDLLELMLETGGAAQLTPDVQRLAAKLDGGRHVILLGSPAWLANDGRDTLSGPLGRIAAPIGDFFGPGVATAALSLHLGETAYAELVAVPPADMKPDLLAKRLFEHVVALPAAVEEYNATIDLHPFGRKLVNRLPAMIHIIEANLRHGTEAKLAILNCHLPPAAPHNIALAAEIALEQQPGERVAATSGATPERQKTGIAAALQKKMSLSIPKDALDRTLQQIAEDTGITIELLGGDLQLEGITQNMSFGLDERDVTLDSLLKTILKKASPEGKLVYVIRKTDDTESIVITTRAKAAERKETLPPGFEQDEPSKKKK